MVTVLIKRFITEIKAAMIGAFEVGVYPPHYKWLLISI